MINAIACSGDSDQTDPGGVIWSGTALISYLGLHEHVL